MTIQLNGSFLDLPDSIETVTGLLKHLDLDRYPVLVELNGLALLKKEFSERPLSGGDRVEIVKMVAGG